MVLQHGIEGGEVLPRRGPGKGRGGERTGGGMGGKDEVGRDEGECFSWEEGMVDRYGCGGMVRGKIWLWWEGMAGGQGRDVVGRYGWEGKVLCITYG